VCISSLSDLPCCLADRAAVRRKCFQNVLDEVLLAPAGGLDRRRLLNSLGAAAAEEGNAAEHRAEDTHGELLHARSQPVFQFFQAIVCDDARSVRCSVSCCSSFPRRQVLWGLGVDVRSASRPCRAWGVGSRRPYLRLVCVI
jgi:hypothetical protein